MFSASTDLEKLVLSKPVQTYIPLEDPVLARLATVAGLTELRLHQTKLPGAALAPFTKLKYLDLSHNRFFDDRGLRHIGRMTALDKLYLTGTSITDDGLRDLAGLSELTDLALDGTGISDAGLAHLAGLTRLRRLNLLGSNVTDAGLVHLQRMTTLEELTLYRTKVSNAGLARLAPLSRLRALDVRYTRVTGGGVASLVSALPKCHIDFLDTSGGQTVSATRPPTGQDPQAVAKWIEERAGKVKLEGGQKHPLPVIVTTPIFTFVLSVRLTLIPFGIVAVSPCRGMPFGVHDVAVSQFILFTAAV